MKRITRLVGIAALATLPSLAQAQDAVSRPWSFGVSGGASVPMGNLSDGHDLGFNLGAHFLFMPASLANLAFRGDVTFDRWAFKEIGGVTVDGNSRALTVAANAIFKSSTAMTIKPYVIGGGGIYNFKGSDVVLPGVGTVEGESVSKPGLQVGGGLEFQLSGFTTFIEAKFINAFTETKSTNWVPVTFGIRF